MSNGCCISLPTIAVAALIVAFPWLLLVLVPLAAVLGVWWYGAVLQRIAPAPQPPVYRKGYKPYAPLRLRIEPPLTREDQVR